MLPAFAKLTLAASQTLKGLFLRIGFPRTPFQESCMGFSLAWYMIIFPHETIFTYKKSSFNNAVTCSVSLAHALIL